MFIACTVIIISFHEILAFYVKFAEAVYHDMHMNVAALVMAIHVSTDKRLVSVKVFLCKFQSQLLSFLTSEASFCITRIEADDVVMRFDFICILVLMILRIQDLTFLGKGKRLAVKSIQIVFIS